MLHSNLPAPGTDRFSVSTTTATSSGKAAAKVLPPEKAKTFTAYDLRHARATQWAETGNLVGVAYLLGHKQVTTTNKYARPNWAAATRVLGVKERVTLHWLRRTPTAVEEIKLCVTAWAA